MVAGLESRVYHEAAAGHLELITPAPEFQQMLMEAIYGAEGVKAGHTQGHCAELLRAAIAHLQGKGASVQILGCTELPLIFAQTDQFEVGSAQTVSLVDPTDVLAKRCVRLARPA
ncbi:Asp/Glu/Hydantoin racemase [compost metagenome]